MQEQNTLKRAAASSNLRHYSRVEGRLQCLSPEASSNQEWDEDKGTSCNYSSIIIHQHKVLKKEEYSSPSRRNNVDTKSVEDIDQTFLTKLKKGAKSGDSEAQYQYGNVFAEGERGMTKDYKKAFILFKLSSEQGHIDATFALGDLYYWGHGIEQDYCEAYRLFLFASQHGQDEAQVFLGYLLLTGKGTKQNLKKSFYWIHRSAQQNHPKAQFDLATYYSFGYGCKANSKLAIKWTLKAVQNNHAPAQYILGVYKIYGEMKRVEQNIQEGIELIKLASEQYDSNAEFLLGRLYRDGIGTIKQDHQLAFKYFERAAAHGSAEAYQALAPLL